jgi:hypothetical protein
VHQTKSPDAGEAIAFFCAYVILGGKKPLVVLVTSSSAEAAGVVVPIPTWEKILLVNTTAKAVRVMIRLNFMC